MSSQETPPSLDTPRPSLPDRAEFARRMHRRQQLRRALVLASVVVVVALGYLSLGSWVLHYRTSVAMAAAGFAVDWRPEIGGWPWEGGSGVRCTHPYLGYTTAHEIDLKRIHDLRDVEVLDLTECTLPEAALSAVIGLPRLIDLSLSRTHHYRYEGTAAGMLGDGCLDPVRGLSRLRRLALAGNRITDAGLEKLSGLAGLEELDLTATEVSDAGLEHLRSLRKLRDLHLGATRVTPQGVKQLQQELPGVEIHLDVDPELERAVKLMRSRQP